MKHEVTCPNCGHDLSRAFIALLEIISEQQTEIERMQSSSEYLVSSTFVASERSTHFHRESCKWAKQIRERNLIEFSSHEEAVAAGYKPCKTCRS